MSVNGTTLHSAYTNSEEETLVVLNVLPSVFSFIGASFIIANYYLFKDLRSFAFKLVLFVAIGDVINSLGNFLGSPTDPVLCDIQGFITQFGDLTSFGWVTAIAWTIYTIFTAKEPPTIDDANRWYKRMHIIIWVSTSVLSLLPVTTGSYGPAGGLCWIKGEVGETTSEVWRWLCFYLPLWGSISYMIFVYSKIWKELKQPSKSSGNQSTDNVTKGTSLENNNASNDGAVPPIAKVMTASDDVHVSSSQIMDDNAGGGSEQNTFAHQNSDGNVAGSGSGNVAGGAGAGGGSGVLQRIKWYPVVLFVCYFWATVRRLDELITGTDAPFWLACIQVFFSALLGTCNACVYGLAPSIRSRDMEYIRGCLGMAEANPSQVNYDENGPLGQTQRLTSKAHLTEHDGNVTKHNRNESDEVELGNTNPSDESDPNAVR